MQCFRDYKSFCPKVSEEWAIDLNPTKIWLRRLWETKYAFSTGSSDI